MELRMTTELEEVKLPELSFNFAELEAELAERLEHYNGLVVTEDAIKDAKADRAKLNKLAQVLDDKRKEVKKQYLVPYTAFENNIKKLTGMVKQSADAIDIQLKKFEEQRKEEKRQLIVEAYDNIVPNEIKSIIPLERIMDQKWLNVTVPIKKAEEALAAAVKRVQADLLVLNTVEESHRPAVKAKYIETMDISAAVEHVKELEAAKAAFRESEETNPLSQPTVEPIQEGEKLYALRLEFQLTQKQAEALKQFLANNHIKYSKI